MSENDFCKYFMMKMSKNKKKRKEGVKCSCKKNQPNADGNCHFCGP